jgi:hypothetical protein
MNSGDHADSLRQLAVQAGLVALDREHVVHTPANEIFGVAVLGVQRIGGDDRTGDVDAVQQRRKALVSSVLLSTTV